MMQATAIKEQMRFALHISTHPFDGFWDMKREKKGRLSFALLLTALMLLTHVWAQQLEAFLFNTDKFVPYDMMFELTKVLLLLGVFCVANWSVTTLMQGEGTFRDIVMTTGYACLPLVLIPLPAAILSNVCTFTEQVYLTAANVLALIWFFFLLFTGIMTIHQYTLGRMLVTTVITAAAMIAILFIGLLFFNLFSQLVSFAYSVYKEILLRT